MGFGEGLFEAMIRGGTLGLSDVLGVTGKDGIIHNRDVPDEQAILVHDDGLSFIEANLELGWDDVVEIVDETKNGDLLYRFALRGGLVVYSGWITGDISIHVFSPICYNTDLCDLDTDDLSDDNLMALQTAIADLSFANNLANELRDSDKIVVDESYLLDRLVWGLRALNLFIGTADDKGKNDIIRQVITDNVFDSLRHWIQQQCKRVCAENLNETDEETQKLIALAFCGIGTRKLLLNQNGGGVSQQKEMYDAYRSARSWGRDVKNLPVQILTMSENEEAENEYVPFGDDVWAKERKLIVCTDNRSAPDTIDDGMKIPGVMVMDAVDIINYNDVVNDDVRLKFELNHPQNGVAYIQHPTLHNVYFSLETFHTTMMERKYEELKYLLTCLGARMLELSAESLKSSDQTQKQRRNISGGVDASIAGEFSSEYSHTIHSSRMNALCKTLSTRRELVPDGKPHIPQDVEFFHTEQSWQRLAKLVMSGSIKREEVSLTYKNESAITGSSLRSICAKLESKIPGYCFGANGAFQDEYEQELKELESLTWNYKVEFGEPLNGEVSDNVESNSCTDASNDVDVNRSEALIRKRAARYAHTDKARATGMLEDAHRADLEKLAEKYGIDAMRLEELIDEAFA